MIIQCDNCYKKFNIDSSLIPEKGRTIQCGSCNHIWFYNPSLNNPVQTPTENPTIEKLPDPQAKDKKPRFTNDIKKNENLIKEKFPSKKKSKEIKELKKNQDTSNKAITFSNILSYLIVGIISFIALIVILDTFKSPLSNYLPGLELLLYNLFETIKDINLFLKDLFI